MKQVIYCDTKKRVISKGVHESFSRAINHRNGSLRNRFAFENESVAAHIEFDGRIDGLISKALHPDCWLIWKVKVSLSDERGGFAPDESLSANFSTYEAAVEYYRWFLVEHAKCFGMIDECGKVHDFAYRGNLLLGQGVEPSFKDTGSKAFATW